MSSLSSLGIGLSAVSGCLFLALVAELCYLLWWRKMSNGDMEDRYRACCPAKELLHLFCWKKPHSLSFAAPNRVDATSRSDEGQLEGKDLLLNPLRGEENVEAELMRFHGLPGPPRLLFTIKEESKEDLESEDSRSRGGGSRKGSRGKSLNDLFLSSDTIPFMTPLPSPPLLSPAPTPYDCYRQSGFNSLFESSKEEDFIRMWASPPPKFKFLKDAEEKLHRKKLMEEGTGPPSHPPAPAAISRLSVPEEEDESFITIVIGKNSDRGQQNHPSSSQVTPLPSSPSSIKLLHGNHSH
ncbi:hypothetical protein OPV22_001878 [Ensete ventricosum]|uniref:Uncharacterized protein n=1 Tax=Ensete ventricosum TaxID=4639 RepID=A0AAV8RM71_ENSVE|nr:hypothetical protein OPV22_001878 [Ensete ventricosum]